MRSLITSCGILILLITTFIPTLSQKTVRVRRKDGTVVRVRDKQLPRPTTPPAAMIGYDPSKVEVNPLDNLSRLVLDEPCAIDLGKGSFYVPGGTGTTRPRRVGPQRPRQ